MKDETAWMGAARSVACWGALLLGLGGCSVSHEKPDSRVDATLASERLDGHERMVRLLAQLRDDEEQLNPYYSRRLLRLAEDELELLPTDADIGQRINLLSRIGDFQIILGDARGGAENLRQAWELLEPVRGRISPETERRALLDVAVGYLRRGEQENCIERCSCDSCLWPIRGSGVHLLPTGSETAKRYLLELLERHPQDLTARWLLNVVAMTLGEYPDEVPESWRIPLEAVASEAEFPRFKNEAVRMGIDIVTPSGGVIADDFDGDGRLDVVMSDWGLSGQLRYFRNEGGGHFVDETETAGLIGLFGGLNLIQADYDNDGDVDILVLRGAWRGAFGRHPNSLLQNDGRGHFRDVTFAAGLGQEHFPTQTAAWADFDNDGDLDLYVGNESYPCQLFENDGRGRFVDIAARAGVTNDEYTKGVVWGDYNNDGYPDLYVSNYGTPSRLANNSSSAREFFAARSGAPNRLFRNNRDGTFTDVAEQLAVQRPMKSFPTWFWDVNNDGVLDLFAASYDGNEADVAAEYLGQPHQAEPDCLYQGDGQGGFREVAAEYGIHRVSQAMGGNFGDLNNDGFDEIYLGTGAPAYESLVPNLMYLNRQGRSFADVTTAGGFGHLQKGHGIAFADLDNDGDQDVVSILGGAYPGDVFANAVFENPGTPGQHWLRLKLIGVRTNRSAIGARVHVEIDEPTGPRSIYKWVNSGGSFGAGPLRREIGLGAATRIRKLTVDWPKTGKSQSFTDVPLDQFFELREGDDKLEVVVAPR